MPTNAATPNDNATDIGVTTIGHPAKCRTSADAPMPRFDLVTGSPPYWDVSEGVVPADSQKAHARFELRGDVRDYCHAARTHLAEGGRFVFCFPTVQRARAHAAIAGADLVLTRSRDVIPRAGAEPLFTLFACRRSEDGDETHAPEPAHIVRDAAGVPTDAHFAIRQTLGFSSP